MASENMIDSYYGYYMGGFFAILNWQEGQMNLRHQGQPPLAGQEVVSFGREAPLS